MNRSFRRATTAVVLGPLLAAIGAAGAAAAPAQQPPESCPASVNQTSEGWVCLNLALNLRGNPTDAAVGRWEGVLARDGREAVAAGIVYSDEAVEALVRRVYVEHLGREADEAGLEHWVRLIQRAGSELPFELAVFSSTEYLARFDSTGTYADSLYRYYLGRPASGEEQELWSRAVEVDRVSHAGLARAVAMSPESGAVRAQRLYADWLRRPADAGGLDYWGARAAREGMLPVVVAVSVSEESFLTLGERGVCLAAGSC